jgi:cyclic pyranopterin phosphate synthase
MPREVFGAGYRFLPRGEVLSFEEITRLAAAFIVLGARKFRLTGGEPLLRHELERLVAMLAALPDAAELTLTTNGLLLAGMAPRLRDAGLDRVSVSLDSLDDGVFRRINDVGVGVDRILEGIEAAASAGFAPIKLNMVVQRGANEVDILPMARFARERGHIVRFIEYMDVGSTNGWRLEDVVAASQILATIDAAFPLEALPPQYPGEVADRWRYRDGVGEIGVIASVTAPFCGDCTRARLSSDGVLYTCLFAAEGRDLRVLVRSAADDAAIRAAVTAIWTARADRYSELRADAAPRPGGKRIEMSRIGG